MERAVKATATVETVIGRSPPAPLTGGGVEFEPASELFSEALLYCSTT